MLVSLVTVLIVADMILTVYHISKGPFKMLLNSFDVCNGPKNKDCANVKVSIVAKNIIFMDMKVTTNCSPSKVIKLTIFLKLDSFIV